MTETIFHESGTFEVPQGVKHIRVRIIGGGGGGGGGFGADDHFGGGGGGGGAFAEKTIVVTEGEMLTVVVGQPGLGGQPGSPGLDGEDSYVRSPTEVFAEGG